MKTILERAAMEGELVNFKFETVPASTLLTELTLATDNVDIDGSGVPAVAPFSGKMLIIVGIEVKNSGVNILEGLFIDEKCIVNGTAKGMVAAEGFKADGEEVTPGSAGSAPVLKDIIGVPFIPCRSKIGVKASVSGAGDKTEVVIRAFVMPCRF